MASLNNLVNNTVDKWIRPWHIEKFDGLTDRDDRFFAIVYKGFIRWLNKNIMMYNKSIRHYIYHTGSTYMYIENNGYDFSSVDTSGEDSMYMELPRCIIEMGNVTINTEDMSSPYVRGTYERKDGNGNITGYNADIKRLPINLSMTLRYICGTFNESIVILEEIINKFVFTQYFNITYLGNVIQCSIEYPGDYTIALNTIDMASPEPTTKMIEIQLTVSTNYPVPDERTENLNSKIISNYSTGIDIIDKNFNVNENVSNEE